MSHEKVETNVSLMGILVALVVAVGGLVWLLLPGLASDHAAMIRAALALSLPALDPKKADEIVGKTLLHRNGQESHSILLQGAAGLGKTNVIVCFQISNSV